MKKMTLVFNVNLMPCQVPKFRGYIGNVYDFVESYEFSGQRAIVRYPLVQFKLLNKGTPTVIAVTDDAVNVISSMFAKLGNILVDGIEYPILRRNLCVEETRCGYHEETIRYHFVSPWIALNPKNYRRYMASGTNRDRNRVLEKTLTGNILLMAKSLGCWLEKDQIIKTEVHVRESKVSIKGNSMIGFKGFFRTNFLIPDYLGLGRKIARGFGTVVRSDTSLSRYLGINRLRRLRKPDKQK